MDGGGDVAAVADEGFLAGGAAGGDDGAAAEEAAEVEVVADFGAGDGDDADAGGFAGGDADGAFVEDDAGEGGGGGVSGEHDHVEADGADGGHAFEFFEAEGAVGEGELEGVVFHGGDECAGEAADGGGGEGAAFFDGVVEHHDGGDGAGAADLLDAHGLVDFADGVADLGGGGEGEVEDAEGDAEAFGDVAADELAGAGDAVGGVFDFFGDFVEGGVGVGGEEFFDGAFDDAGAGDACVDDDVGLACAEEGAGHEGVVFGDVCEDDHFGAAEAVDGLGGFGDLEHGLGDEVDGVDVDAGAGGADVDGGADVGGFGEGAGEGFDEGAFAGGDAFVDEGGEAAEEVDAELGGGAVEGFAELDGGVLVVAFEEHGGGGDGDAFVDDVDAEEGGGFFAGFDEVFGDGHDAVVDGGDHLFGVWVRAAAEVDAHGAGADVEVFLVDHAEGGKDGLVVDHGSLLDDGFDGGDFAGGAEDGFVAELCGEAALGEGFAEGCLDGLEVVEGGAEGDVGEVGDVLAVEDGGPVFDVDAVAGHEVGDGEHDAGLVFAGGGGDVALAGAGDVFADLLGVGHDGEDGAGGEEAGEGLLQAVADVFLVLGDEDEGEEAADDRLAHVGDVAVEVDDGLGDVTRQADAVWRDDGDEIGVSGHGCSLVAHCLLEYYTIFGALARPGEQRTERAGPKGQTFHGHREQNARQARDGWRGGGTVEGLPCGADTKGTKDHEDTRRTARMEKPPMFRRFARKTLRYFAD